MGSKVAQTIFLCLVGGAIYWSVEWVYKTFIGAGEGRTHWSMFLLAAILSLPLDQINEHMSWDTPIWLQMLMGGAGITIAELIAGLVLNVWLDLRIWDYTLLPWNFMGQISIQYSVLWVLLAGVGIVIFDILRWLLFREEIPRYSMWFKNDWRSKK